MLSKVHRSSCKVPAILARFQLNLNFLNRFSKNAQISNFMKILPVGVTGMAKLIVFFFLQFFEIA